MDDLYATEIFLLEPKGYGGKAAWAFFNVNTLRIRRSNDTNIIDKVHRLFSVVFTPSPPSHCLTEVLNLLLKANQTFLYFCSYLLYCMH